MRARFTATLYAVIALAFAVFAVPAFAGDHGGGGWGHDHQQAAQQQPSDQQQQSSDQHGGWKHDQGGSQSSSSQQQSGSSTDNSTGVKPSNSTQHDTHAAASSNQTKQYGNGKTAGQIATQAGYGDATLHGPGNSQPHKTSCGGHEVDVHALKAHGGDCGQAQQQQAEQTQGCGCQSQSEQSSQAKAAEEEQQQDEQEQKQVEQTQSCGCQSQTEQSSQVKAAEDEQQQDEEEQQVQQTQSSEVPAVVELTHVTICHATGSSTNPFVRISPSASGVFHGHMGHQDARDIIPPFTWNGMTFSQNWDTNGQAIWNAGCAQPAAQVQSATETQQAPSAQASEENESAEQETQSTEETESAPSSSAVVIQQSPTATQAPTASAQAPAAATQSPSTATQAPASSGVLGASVALKRPKAKPAAGPKAAGGVLGTTTPLRSAVTSGTLPFTGLPLWPFLLGAAVLLAIGIASRFAAADRRAS